MSLSVDVYFAVQDGKVQNASLQQNLCQAFVKTFNRHRARGTPKAKLLSRKIDLASGFVEKEFWVLDENDVVVHKLLKKHSAAAFLAGRGFEGSIVKVTPVVLPPMPPRPARV